MVHHIGNHIGIVACSAEGAALCYRTLCLEGERDYGPHGHPEISLHGQPLGDYVERLERHDWPGVGDLMLRSAHKLAGMGCDLLICPDNTIHRALPFIAPRLPRPWLHIADAVAEQAQRCGFRRLGILGTRWLVEGEVYPEYLAARSLECVRPDSEDRESVHRIIMTELVRDVRTPEALLQFQQIIGRLKKHGCDAVVLGCTEIPLLINDNNSPLPTLDSTRLLARAALRLGRNDEDHPHSMRPLDFNPG